MPADPALANRIDKVENRGQRAAINEAAELTAGVN